MILFDLRCGAGHVFEGWFGSSGDYDDQRQRGLLSCPLCGSGEVGKAAMAPAVPAKGREPGVPMAAGDAVKAKAMMAMLARAQAEMLKDSAYVGRRFASEARAIHDGDVPHRVIHGEASPGEAKALVADGIAVSPLPLPVRPPGTDN